MEPGSDVHAIAKHIAIVLDNVAQMNTNADVDLLGFLLLRVWVGMRPELLGALHGIDDGREVHQKGIADGFDNCAVISGDRLLNDLIMDAQQP